MSDISDAQKMSEIKVTSHREIDVSNPVSRKPAMPFTFNDAAIERGLDRLPRNARRD